MHKTDGQQAKIRWKKDVLPSIKKTLQHFNLLGIAPNFKTIFYALVLLDAIPNTQYHYQHLSRFMLKARINGKLSSGSFMADTRTTDNVGDEYITAKEYIDKIAYYIRTQAIGKCTSTIKKKYPFKSDHYVEIWLEKYSLYNNFQSLLKGTDVNVIVPSKKFSGFTNFVNENVERLKICNFTDKQNKICIKYFGNFDPDYHKCEEMVNKKFQYYKSDVDFKILAITTEQVEKFHLPKNPNPKKITIGLLNNSKKDDLNRKYGSTLQIELESLLAYAPEMFKKLLINSCTSNDFSECQTFSGIL